jgi:hypothetical protein
MIGHQVIDVEPMVGKDLTVMVFKETANLARIRRWLPGRYFWLQKGSPGKALGLQEQDLKQEG